MSGDTFKLSLGRKAFPPMAGSDKDSHRQYTVYLFHNEICVGASSTFLPLDFLPDCHRVALLSVYDQFTAWDCITEDVLACLVDWDRSVSGQDGQHYEAICTLCYRMEPDALIRFIEGCTAEDLITYLELSQ